MVKKDKKLKTGLEKDLVLLEAKLKRALADYDNLEKRVAVQRRGLIEFARLEIFDKFVAVLDDLERAEKSINDKGLSLVANQFRGVFESEGVKTISPEGKVFDPEKMDCVGICAGSKNSSGAGCFKGLSLKR